MQAATVVAAFVYNTAQRDEKLLRKEWLQPRETRRSFSVTQVAGLMVNDVLVAILAQSNSCALNQNGEAA